MGDCALVRYHEAPSRWLEREHVRLLWSRGELGHGERKSSSGVTFLDPKNLKSRFVLFAANKETALIVNLFLRSPVSENRSQAQSGSVHDPLWARPEGARTWTGAARHNPPASPREPARLDIS